MWFILIGILLAISLYGLWLLFKKAGKQGWEALIPFYREYVLAQLTGRPTWWVILLIVPIVNIFIFYALYLDFIKSFGLQRFWHNAVAVLFPFIFLPMWGADKDLKYLGQPQSEEFKKKYPYKKSVGREWADAIIFATVAASLIRGFLIEAYMIPTGSMERSLLVGDFLFVSKLSYGPRIPMTPIAFPFAHHTMPVTQGKAYLEWVKVPYKRLPGFTEIKRNDVVVFNYPMEADEPFNRPVDKRENYIKRAIGIPGDKIESKEGTVYVNGEVSYKSKDLQLAYIVISEPNGLNPQRIIEKRLELDEMNSMPSKGFYVIHMTEEEAHEVSTWANVKQVTANIFDDSDDSASIQAFPFYKDKVWNYDNFGPITVPKKGWTVELDSLTLPLYERAITIYEGKKLEENSNGIFIDGKLADEYTFEMDYYWMMGDNRHNSLDSRGWGFVPEDHIVGKASFVFMSWDKDGTFIDKIRWSRIFRSIK